jgi:hypothetical protein
LSLTLLALLTACEGNPNPVDATGGHGGESEDREDPRIGEGGGEAGATGNPRSKGLFRGEGVQVEPTNELGVTGSFFILEDSVDENGLVEGFPGLAFTNLTPDTGDDSPENPVSQFTSKTHKPCVSGELARVTTTSGNECDSEGTDCAWDQLWGGGIGLVLERADSSAASEGWPAKAWGVRGIRFETSGDRDGAPLRFHAKDATHEDVEFCAPVRYGQNEIRFSELTQNCYLSQSSSGGVIDAMAITEISWRLVTDSVRSHRIESFCIESVEAID